MNIQEPGLWSLSFTSPGRLRTIVPVLRSGIVAAEFCQPPGRADVTHVFERSFYLRAGDTFICVGDAAIGIGPLTLLAEFGAHRRAADFGLMPGDPAFIRDDRIVLGTVAFTLDRCAPWRPPAWPRARSTVLLAHARDAIVRLAASEAPEDGFGRAMSGTNEGGTVLARAARKRIAVFESWLTDTIHADGASLAALPDPVRDLIGLGPGLTPSGDDFLIGALALLDALAQRRAYVALSRALVHIPRGLTSPLSHCFLRTAAAGHVGENLHRAISAIISGHVDAAIAAIRNVGHGSGWDMMAGIASALGVVLAIPSRSRAGPTVG